MPVVISMLRAVNLGAYNHVKMDALRAVYEVLGLRAVMTHVQSGNVVFRTNARDLAALAKRIENAIEDRFGFRSSVILRTPAELRNAIARNPFAWRPDIDPSRLLVTFLAAEPDQEARAKVLAIRADPEELRIDGRELYIYFPNGMARPKLSIAAVERALKTPCTGRNWNTVTKLLEIAAGLGG